MIINGVLAKRVAGSTVIIFGLDQNFFGRGDLPS